MRLLKCNVENYGKLSHYSMDFSRNLTVITEENGFGKTTLASFIKAMFYGLPVRRVADLNENERKKFAPWQGGNFGGSLDFEVGGKSYRVERFFSDTPKNDTYKLFDLELGAQCDDYSQNLGVELFGIDADGFEKSIYLPQTNVKTSMTSSLGAKLSGLDDSSDDLGNYDVAVKALKKRKDSFCSSRGLTKGTLVQTQLDIQKIEAELADCITASDDLKQLDSAIQLKIDQKIKLEAELENTRNRLRTAAETSAILADKKRRDGVKQNIERLEITLASIKTKYPNGLPDLSEIYAQSEKLNKLNTIISETQVLNTFKEQDELTKLQNFFDQKIPTEQEVEEYRLLAKKAEINSERLKMLKATSPQDKDEELIKGGSKTGVIIGLILSAFVLCFGVVALFKWQVLGIVALLLGAFGIGISGFLYLKNMIATSSLKGTENKANSREIALIEVELEGVLSKLDGFLAGFPCKNSGYDAAINEVIINLRDYSRLKKEITENKQQVSLRQEKSAQLKAEISEFFAKYCAVPPADFSCELENIKTAVSEQTRVVPELERLQQELKEIPEYDVKNQHLTEVDLTELSAEEKKLGEQISELNRLLSTEQSRRAAFVLMADRIPELESTIDNLKINEQEYSNEVNILDITANLLEEAKNNLSNRYMHIVKHNFGRYMQVITGEETGEFLVDSELGINFERYGSSKTSEYFSSGYKDMANIAMRMALIDALYGENRPMLILDDPFINMDDVRVKNALNLLKKLAECNQIVYFTCHSSRAFE